MAVPAPTGSLPRGHAARCVIIPPLTLRLAGCCSLPFSVGHPRSAGPYSNWTPMRWMRRRAAKPSSAWSRLPRHVRRGHRRLPRTPGTWPRSGSRAVCRTPLSPAVAAPDGQDLGGCRPARKLGRTGHDQHARPVACAARRYEHQRRNARVRAPRKTPSGMYQVRDVACPVVVGGHLAASPTHFEIKDSDERGTTVEHRTWRSGCKPGSAAWHPTSPEVGFADATRHLGRDGHVRPGKGPS